MLGLFLKPVDPIALGIPDYFEVIKNPMDLGTIEQNLKSHSYREVDEFVSDVRLVFENACLYNLAESEIVHSAKELRTTFESKYSTCKWDMSPGKASDYNLPAGNSNKKVPKKSPGPVAPKIEHAPPQHIAPQYATPARSEPVGRMEPTLVEMSFEEKRMLGEKMNRLTSDQLARVVNIISENRVAGVNGSDEDIEIDMNDLDAVTLRKLETYVNDCLMTDEERARLGKKRRDQEDDVNIDDQDDDYGKDGKKKKKSKQNGFGAHDA